MGSCNCGAKWTGARIEHCPACHETFTGTVSGDKHRTGKHAVSVGPDRRRCLTEAEMLAIGMTRNGRGHWTQGGTFWVTRNDSESTESATLAPTPHPGGPDGPSEEVA